jgi:hypothetical protein
MSVPVFISGAARLSISPLTFRRLILPVIMPTRLKRPSRNQAHWIFGNIGFLLAARNYPGQHPCKNTKNHISYLNNGTLSKFGQQTVFSVLKWL